MAVGTVIQRCISFLFHTDTIAAGSDIYRPYMTMTAAITSFWLLPRIDASDATEILLNATRRYLDLSDTT